MAFLYSSMARSMELLPKRTNAKLLLRHSIRDSLRNVMDPDTIDINEDGKKAARLLRESLTQPIGSCYASPIRRCISTLRQICNNESYKITASDVLGFIFIDYKFHAQEYFRKNSLKQTVLDLVSEAPMKGFISAKKGVQLILNLIFGTGGIDSTIDLYCTHDLQLAILDAFMINHYKTEPEIRLNWPGMLEGMFFYGIRSDFYCIWRGEIYHFKDYLM